MVTDSSLMATGAVIVSTPQDLALKDAIKGIEMFNKMQIPVSQSSTRLS